MKTLQTLGIDYEVVGLDTEGSDVSGPVQPERLIDDEIAHLSGHLFDQLPQQVLPLDSFFAPATAQDGTPSAARSDSIAPTAIDGTFAPAAIDGTFATAAIDGTFAPAPTGAPPLPRRTGWGFHRGQAGLSSSTIV